MKHIYTVHLIIQKTQKIYLWNTGPILQCVKVNLLILAMLNSLRKVKNAFAIDSVFKSHI